MAVARESKRDDLAYPVLEAAHPDRRRHHRESDALGDGQLGPARHHRAGEVSVPDEQHVAALHLLERVTDGVVSPVADLLQVLSARAAVRPHQPVGHLLADLLRGQALVVAVIPLGQQGRDLVDVQPRQFGRHLRASPRTRHHEEVVELQDRQRIGGELGLLSPGFGEIEFSAAGMPAGFRPLGLTVTKQNQPVPQNAHGQ